MLSIIPDKYRNRNGFLYAKNYEYSNRIIKKQKQIPLCTWLYRTAFINWDLGVSPCCNYYTGEKNHDFGNLKDQTFSVIWNSDKYIEARRMFKEGNGNYSNENICHKCITKRKILRGYLQYQPEQFCDGDEIFFIF